MADPIITDTQGKSHSRKMFSLKQQISRILLSLIIIVTLLLVILLITMIRSYQNEQSKRRLNELTVYAETLDNDIRQLNDITGTIYSINNAFQGIYSYASVPEKCEHINTLMNLLQIQVKSYQSISGLFVYYDNYDNVLYYVNEHMPFEDKETIKNSGKIAAINDLYAYNNSVIQRTAIATDTDVYYNVLMKKSSAAIGGSIRLSLGLPDEKEANATYGIIYDNSFYRTAGEHHILTSDELAALGPGQNRINGAVVYLHELGTANISVIEVLPQSLWLYVNGTHIILMFLCLFFLFMSVRLYRYVTVLVTGPLEDMTDALLQIQAGVWEVKFTAPNRIVEIENVRQAVSVMLKAIEQYKIQSYEDQLEGQKTQLQYFQLQLAPHFYTNCLKNAYCMLMLKEYDNVEHFLLRLSTHLRYLLQKDKDMVQVQTEQDFVLNYISLQKQMTAKPITCEISVDEEALGQEIPILTLQTFVENSIKYARNAESNNLLIRVSVRYRVTEKRDYLDITVYDNGPGYPAEVLRILNQKEPSKEHNFGVGITNLQSRIGIHYGNRANWYFDNTTGAFSELILPVK